MRALFFYKVFIGLLLGIGFTNVQAQPKIVISQVYGGAGCGTAGCSTYQNDFIEIFNAGNVTQSLNGWSVQYASATGTTWQVTNLTNVSLQPGQYYLIAESFSANGVSPLPTPDVNGVIVMSSAAAKVALLNVTTALSGACPTGSQIKDFVGYGGTANCFEGAASSAPGTTTSVLRKNSGCTDSDNNLADFVALSPTPRNTSSPFNLCAGMPGLSINDVSQNEGNAGTTSFTFTVSLSAPAPTGGVTFNIATADGTALAPGDYTSKSLTGQTIPAGSSTYLFTVLINGDVTTEPNETFFVNITNLNNATVTDGQGQGTIQNDDLIITPINVLQGSGNTSPVAGQNLVTTGIVTGIKSNGFFLQTPDANVDADPNTSEGIFVFTSTAPPASVSIGNSISVSGTITEFIPASDPYSLSVTEIISPTISLSSTGNSLPAPILLTIASTDPAGSIYQLEKYEGMRVKINSFTVTGSTNGSVNEINATAASTGIFYGVVAGIASPFRQPGVDITDPLPPGSPVNVPRWDANPEVLTINSKAQTGGGAIDVSAGAIVSDIIGPLDYSRRFYTIDADFNPAPLITNNNRSYTATPASTVNEVSIASLNLERFFNDADDPAISEPVLTTNAYNNRLNKASLLIRNVLNYPDVIGVQEAEDLTTLQTLANKINADAIATAVPNPAYVSYLTEGNDLGGIDVGFLVKSSKISVVDVIQFGKIATYTDPNNGTATLYDRPPLKLRATFAKPGCNTAVPFTVFVNHLRSLVLIDDPVSGNSVRTKRRAQAEYFANLIQSVQASDPSEKIICIGDYNSNEFNDGYVDVTGTIKGTPAPADQVVLSSSDLINPDLINLTDSYASAERYTYSYQGNRSALDHIFITQNLSSQVSNYAISRSGADFAEVIRNDAMRPERLTDHDAPVVFFNFACPTSSTDYFRSKQTGNWNSINTWESSQDNINWVNATRTPDFNALSITIKNPHSVTVTANVIAAHLFLETGSNVTTLSGITLTVK